MSFTFTLRSVGHSVCLYLLNQNHQYPSVPFSLKFSCVLSMNQLFNQWVQLGTVWAPQWRQLWQRWGRSRKGRGLASSFSRLMRLNEDDDDLVWTWRKLQLHGLREAQDHKVVILLWPPRKRVFPRSRKRPSRSCTPHQWRVWMTWSNSGTWMRPASSGISFYDTNETSSM